MKKAFLTSIVALLFPLFTFAGADRAVTVDPVYLNDGNCWRPISVTQSTQTMVLISSTAVDTNIEIGSWRRREIVNTSDGVLTLFPNSSKYTAFSATYSVVLGSDTATPYGTMGDSWVTGNQGAIWGIWSSSTTRNGAGGSEEYWSGDTLCP